MVIRLKYFPPLLIAAAAAASIAAAPIAAAADSQTIDPGYVVGGSAYVGGTSSGADPFVHLGTQFLP